MIIVGAYFEVIGWRSGENERDGGVKHRIKLWSFFFFFFFFEAQNA